MTGKAKTETPEPQPDDVLRRLLSTPPEPHAAPKKKPLAKKPAARPTLTPTDSCGDNRRVMTKLTNPLRYDIRRADRELNQAI